MINTYTKQPENKHNGVTAEKMAALIHRYICGVERRCLVKALRDGLLASFKAFRLRKGNAIPSNAALSQSIGIAHITLRKVLAELAKEGVLEQIQGKGTFLRQDFSEPIPKIRNRALIQLPKLDYQYAVLMNAINEVLWKEGIRTEVESSAWRFDNKFIDGLIADADELIGLVRSPSIWPLTLFNEVAACQSLARQGMPVIFVDRLIHAEGIACVGFDDITGMEQVFDAAWSLGYRNFYFFINDINKINMRYVERISGFHCGAEKHGYDSQGKVFSLNNTGYNENVHDLLKQLLSVSPVGKTAFMSDSETTAAILRSLLSDLDSDRDDILVTGYDYLPELFPHGPSTISTSRDRHLLGETAGKLLMQLIGKEYHGISVSSDNHVKLKMKIIINDMEQNNILN